jgi:hypothetical protein
MDDPISNRTNKEPTTEFDIRMAVQDAIGLDAHTELLQSQECMHMQGRGKPIQLQVGEEVWLDGCNLPVLGHRKFSPRRFGLLCIKKRISNWAYELELPHQWCIHLMFHVHLLSKYHQTTAFGTATPKALPNLVEGSKE